MNKEDTKVYLRDNTGKEYVIYQTEKVDLEEELNKIITELNQYKDKWNKLKDFLEDNWKETQDIWFVKIINKMQELDGVVNNE